MVAILDPREGMRQSETNVMKALILPERKRGELRMLGGQYKSMHTVMEKYPLDTDTVDPASLTGQEKRLYHHGYGKGYLLGVQAALQVMAGETAVAMFTAWAEPVDHEGDEK